jgi:serine/threonine protein kinase
VSELYEGGDLEKIIFKYKHLYEKNIRQLIYEIYKGLLYLNSVSIVHRDFKPANIFLDSSGSPRIADFGFAVKADRPFKDINIGSPIYMSPEGLILHEYGPKTDVWAFGILLYEMLHGDTPLSSCRNEK